MVALIIRQRFRAVDGSGISEALQAIFGVGTATVPAGSAVHFEQQSLVDDGVSATRLASTGTGIQVSTPPSPDLIVIAVHEGSLELQFEDQNTLVASGQVGLIPLGGSVSIRWSDRVVLEIVSFPTASIGRLLGPVDQRPQRPQLNIARYRNQDRDMVDLWTRTSQHVVSQILQKPGLFESDIIREQAIDALLAVTIEAFGISQVAEDLPFTTRSAVEAADGYMRLHLARPISIPDVAHAIGISVRGLQLAYRTHRGTTPLVHLRQLRMHAAHEALAAPGPTTTVTSVAQSLAYTNLGRFSAHYREAHQQNPAETLRAAQQGSAL